MKYLLICISLFTATYSCQAQSKNNVVAPNANTIEPEYRQVSNDFVKKIIQSNNDYVFIDVRSPEEIKEGKIENALEIDIKSEDFKTKLDKLDRNKIYIVYCYAGGRSTKATDVMVALGFKRVYNLTSGYRDWKQSFAE